jgi:hypothetical protein
LELKSTILAMPICFEIFFSRSLILFFENR